MRKNRRSIRTEAKRDREPYELDLDSPPEGHPGFVTITDPNRLSTEDAELLRGASPETFFTLLMSPEDFDLFWAEQRTQDIEDSNALIGDVGKHYGADRGKLPR